uniref:2-keto-3-deoxygluconate permease n=1 Tax=Methylobacterium sp. B34 TaxID=95563 RepID=UPI0005B28D13
MTHRSERRPTEARAGAASAIPPGSGASADDPDREGRAMQIKAAIDRIPGGLMLVPLLLGALARPRAG